MLIPLGLILLAGTAHAQTVVKREPPMGTMRPGDVLLVDNGKCPKGQILRVTAGSFGAIRGGKGVSVAGGPASRARQAAAAPVLDCL